MLNLRMLWSTVFIKVLLYIPKEVILVAGATAGVGYVVDDTKPLQSQFEALSLGSVTHVANLNSLDSYLESYTELLATFVKSR